MATKKEIKSFLKEQNLTETEMTVLYENLASTNKLVRVMIEKGKRWQDWNLYIFRDIKSQKQSDVESLRLITESEQSAAIDKKEKKIADDYYYEHFLEIMFKKIEDKENLTEQELLELVDYEFDREEGDSGRWTQNISSYIKNDINGKLYCINWECGLTEYQENEFYQQPYEVVKKERVITETYYEMVK
jgi:hypothetical protein